MWKNTEVRIIKSYHILTVNNALVESVYYFMECTVLSLDKLMPGGHKME